MQDLAAQFQETIRSRKLLSRGARVLVAVSGGLDSMVLLHLLQEHAAAQGWKLCVAHFNHRLRGRASAADARLVQTVAARLGLPVRLGRGNVRARAAARGESIEMAARELRHQFLAATARRWRCPVIALAHHADDQVELFFLRVLRGAGGEGVAGMKWMAPSPVAAQVRLVRPLLEVSRAELEAFARARRIPFREDASNASREMLRNRLRHELLPQLRREYQPALNRAVLRLMEVTGAEAEVVSELAEAWRRRKPSGRGWAKLARAVQRRVIQAQLRELGATPEFDLVEALRLGPGRMVSAGVKTVVICDAAGRVTRRAVGALGFRRAQARVRLGAGGGASFGGLRVSWNITPGRGRGWRKPLAGGEQFDAKQVGPTVILRHWRAGDRFQPIGMKTAVKLQDWFTNLKIPAGRRRELVVGTTLRGEIFWVQDQRIGERFKLTAATREVLNWQWAVG
jgi:tRNA(Ile)-lysidine synthase